MKAAIHYVYKVSLSATTHRIEHFLKGVWWNSTNASKKMLFLSLFAELVKFDTFTVV